MIGSGRRRRFHVLAGAALVAVIATSAAAETILRARLNADILSTEPGTRRDENTDAVLLHVVEGLVASREDGSVGPMLASRWAVSDGGRTYAFTLRPDVRFHNGQPLTASDVVWSLRRYLSLGAKWRCGSEFGPKGIATILEVAAPDPATVLIRLDRPAPFLLKTLARADCGGTGIVHRASVGADGRWIAPIGTGPFRWATWRRNQFIELERFHRYAALPGPPDGNTGGKRPLVDRVRFLIIPDSSAAKGAVLRGSLDVLDALNPTEQAGLRDRPDVRIQVAPTMDFYALLFQVDDPTLRDVRLRRAIALCLDTAGLSRAITWRTGQANSSPVPASSPFYGAVEAAPHRPDLAQARRLAQAAGYHGQPISLITNRRYPQMFDAAVVIQAMARSAGIDLRIETLDWASQLERYGAGRYQAMVFAYSARLDPSLNFGSLIGDRRTDRRKVWGSPLARSLLKASVESSDPRARQAAFNALQRAFLADAPAVVLFNSARISAVRSNVIGYRSWPAAQQRLWKVSKR